MIFSFCLGTNLVKTKERAQSKGRNAVAIGERVPRRLTAIWRGRLLWSLEGRTIKYLD